MMVIFAKRQEKIWKKNYFQLKKKGRKIVTKIYNIIKKKEK